MNTRLSRMRGAVAAGATLAIALVACDVDDVPGMPFEESPEETQEDTEREEPDAGEPEGDEAAALPAGVFGPECQRLLESVEHDEMPLAGREASSEEAPGDTDTGVTDDDRASDDGAPGDNDTGVTDEDGATDDDEPGDSAGDDAATRLASMSMREALEAIPALRPLAAQLDGLGSPDALEQGALTVFAPTEDALQGQLDGNTMTDDTTSGEKSEEGTTNGDTTTDGTGQEDDATGQEERDADESGEEVGTDQQDEGAGTGDDDVGDGADTGAVDVTDAVGVHIHADGALDATELLQQSQISTLHDEVELEVRAETEAGVTTDEQTDDDTASTEDAATGDDATTGEDGAGDGTATSGLTLVVDAQGPEATVLCANIETADGYIHVIDEVLDAGQGVGAEDEDAGTDTDGDTEDPLDDGGQDDADDADDAGEQDGIGDDEEVGSGG